MGLTLHLQSLCRHAISLGPESRIIRDTGILLKTEITSMSFRGITSGTCFFMSTQRYERYFNKGLNKTTKIFVLQM